MLSFIFTRSFSPSLAHSSLLSIAFVACSWQLFTGITHSESQSIKTKIHSHYPLHTIHSLIHSFICFTCVHSFPSHVPDTVMFFTDYLDYLDMLLRLSLSHTGLRLSFCNFQVTYNYISDFIFYRIIILPTSLATTFFTLPLL